MTVFHSGHLFHLPKFSGQPYRGQKTLITVNIFPVIFSDDIFRHQAHHQERKEEICNFSQSTGAKNSPTRHSSTVAWIPRAGAWGRVAHFPMPGFFQQARLALSCTSKPSSVLFEPCFSIFLAFQPPRVFFQLPPASDGNSLPWPRPVCALGRPLLHPQSLFSFVWVPTY